MDFHDLLFPKHLEHGVEKYARAGLDRGADFGSGDRAFGNLMSNPSMIARGGTWVDPMQLQEQATSGYLSNRGSVAENWMQEQARMAALAAQAGQNRGSIAAMIPSLQAGELGAQNSLFGGLLGGLM